MKALCATIRRRRGRLAGALVLAALALPLGGAAPRRPDGLLVWESNRTGDWRIFAARLDGSQVRQLSPDDDLQHCCAHLAPDGGGLVYLARDVPKGKYPVGDVNGELRWVRTDGSGSRVVAPAARSYGWGNRAAIWHDAKTLAYIDGEGRSALLDVASGRSTRLTTTPRRQLGYLIDPTRRYATSGAPSFSDYDAARHVVREARLLDGCEPYFTADGRFGYWIAGNGGPLFRMELANRQIRTVIRQNDSRLGERRYVYFAMVSRDGRWLAYGASAGKHHHFRADYDLYVVALDPAKLELAGTPIRVVEHPATDRYPDLWVRSAP